MQNTVWLEIDMKLEGTQNQVQRTIVVPEFLSMYYLHIILASLFHFDDLLDVEIQNEDIEILISENNIELNERMFDSLKSFLDASGKQEFSYKYYGQDIWEIKINIAMSKQAYQHITCISAIGNGILYEQMTKETYNDIVEYQKAPDSDAALTFFATYPDFQQLDIKSVNLDELQHKLSLLEINLLDEDERNYELTDEGVDEEVFNNETNAEMPYLNEEFDTRNFLMFLYHEVAGFSVDQAAYEILYRTNLGDIVDLMYELGYEDDVIEKTLQLEIPFDERVYEQAAEAIDLLNILPSREEIFDEEEEQFLDTVDMTMLSVLEKNQIDLADLGTIDGALEDKVNQELILQITKLREQRLS